VLIRNNFFSNFLKKTNSKILDVDVYHTILEAADYRENSMSYYQNPGFKNREIMVACDYYYLVSPKVLEKVIELL